MICASVYLLVFIRSLLVHLAEKILLLQPLKFEGIAPPYVTPADVYFERGHSRRSIYYRWLIGPLTQKRCALDYLFSKRKLLRVIDHFSKLRRS